MPVLILIGISLMGAISDSPVPASENSDPLALSIYRPVVRLRKLHLVRPDLIPYPLANEIYC